MSVEPLGSRRGHPIAGGSATPRTPFLILTPTLTFNLEEGIAQPWRFTMPVGKGKGKGKGKGGNGGMGEGRGGAGKGGQGEGSGGKAEGHTVFVGNISYRVTEDAFASLFSICGEVREITVK